MASIPTNPIPSAPKKDPCYSDAEGFQEVIRLAMKTDHQIYTKKTLAPCSFSLNAQRPGILDIIKAPYRLISTYTQKTKETLKDYSASLEKTQLRLLS
ncbi:MAG: hypothetical protein FJZ63_04390, partial [Chlamydiae bacterium]|nr:hypothetical protein [Chlamydiota bacterium]